MLGNVILVDRRSNEVLWDSRATPHGGPTWSPGADAAAFVAAVAEFCGRDGQEEHKIAGNLPTDWPSRMAVEVWEATDRMPPLPLTDQHAMANMGLLANAVRTNCAFAVLVSYSMKGEVEWPR